MMSKIKGKWKVSSRLPLTSEQIIKDWWLLTGELNDKEFHLNQ